jgi:uncharacterized OsmC-like protein
MRNTPKISFSHLSVQAIIMSGNPALEYHVKAERLDSHGSVARCKFAAITLDTDVSGRGDAFNPAELLLASVAACMIKSVERVTPLLNFRLDGVEVHVHAKRQDNPPKLIEISYELIVDTDESDRRLALLHQSVRKFGTVSNTIGATPLVGSIRRELRADKVERAIVDVDEFRTIDESFDSNQLTRIVSRHNRLREC